MRTQAVFLMLSIIWAVGLSEGGFKEWLTNENKRTCDPSKQDEPKFYNDDARCVDAGTTVAKFATYVKCQGGKWVIDDCGCRPVPGSTAKVALPHSYLKAKALDLVGRKDGSTTVLACDYELQNPHFGVGKTVEVRIPDPNWAEKNAAGNIEADGKKEKATAVKPKVQTLSQMAIKCKATCDKSEGVVVV